MSSEMTPLRECPICRSSGVQLRFVGRTNRDVLDPTEWEVHSCDDCGHGFINPQPGPAILDRYYTESYEPYDERHGSAEEDAEILAEARRAREFRHIPLPAGKRVLDFGCGGGFFLNICRGLGAEVEGIEPSPFGAAATRRQGIPVFQGTLDQYLETNGERKFDIITSNHVIEHVPDPIGALSGLRQLLAPGGLMVIAVPNADSMFARALGAEWFSTDLPFHLHQFSTGSFRRAAEATGLKVERLGTTSLPSSTAASLQLLLRKKYLVPRKLSSRLPLIDRFARYLARRQDAAAEGEALLARLRH